MMLLQLSLLLPAVMALEPWVTCRQEGTVGLGEDVILTCNFLANKDVLQVTWQKKRGKNTQNMVTHSEKYGTNIDRRFENHVSVLQANSTISSIQISKLETEDEACYNCLFNAYPEGAYPGEVCLHKLGVVNKVECTARGSDLGVDLNPQRIQTRHHVQHSISGAERSVQKGEYPENETNLNPNCTFTLHSRARRSRSLHESLSNPSKRADETIVVQCQASGKDKLRIMWQNEGDPISREDKENKTGDVITVTSTLHLSASSLSAEHKINCNFTHSQTTAAVDVEKKGMVEEAYKDTTPGTTTEPVYKYQVLSAAGVISSLLILIVILASIRKNSQQQTPKKDAKSGPGTPTLIAKYLLACSPMKYSKSDKSNSLPATPRNSIQIKIPATPRNSDQETGKEHQGSSLKKRRPGSHLGRKKTKELFPGDQRSYEDDKLCEPLS
ncbi:uncharacterized protein [Hyperolius riggenbachi]|uniref:uncharacterized protein isoform X2 n=1 Tax=Hyperolius riggenbachi TaxID=752182 RepID=UPI0035A31F9A